MEQCLSDSEFARLTDEEKRLYIDLLHAFVQRRLANMTEAQRKHALARVAALRLGIAPAEYSSN